MIYKLLPLTGVRQFNNGYVTDIPFVPDNTSYENFKKQINADEAQLEDADGNLMTPEQADDFIKELP